MFVLSTPIPVIQQTHWRPLGGRLEWAEMKRGRRQMGSLQRRGWNEWSERKRNTHLRPDICWQRHALLLDHSGESTGVCESSKEALCVRVHVYVKLYPNACEWEHATWPGLITTSIQGPSKHGRLPRYCLGWPAKTLVRHTHTQTNTHAHTTDRATLINEIFKKKHFPSSCNRNYLQQKVN